MNFKSGTVWGTVIAVGAYILDLFQSPAVQDAAKDVTEAVGEGQWLKVIAAIGALIAVIRGREAMGRAGAD